MWLPFTINSILSLCAYALKEGPKKEKLTEWAENFQTYSMYSAILTGFVVSIVRTREPYFKYLAKKEFLEWFGILISDKDTKNS